MYEIDSDTEENLEKMWAFVVMYRELFEEYKLDAISAECWTAMQQLVGAMPCTSYGILADMDYIISCESDMHAAITQVLLKSLTFGEKKPCYCKNMREWFQVKPNHYTVARIDQDHGKYSIVAGDRIHSVHICGQNLMTLMRGKQSSSKNRTFTMFQR